MLIIERLGIHRKEVARSVIDLINNQTQSTIHRRHFCNVIYDANLGLKIL
jgi:intergrase/recombinase